MALAEAYCHGGGARGCPLQKHTGPPRLRSLSAEAGWTPNDTLIRQRSNEEISNTEHTKQTQKHARQPPKEHTTQKTHNIQDNQTLNNNRQIIPYESEEPSHTLPSRGSTGQPRSLQTCGDQERPPFPLRPRNTNRGLRNPNTMEIRREQNLTKED